MPNRVSTPTNPRPAARAAAVSPSGRPWLVILSASPWHVAAHRQQALARELSRAGGDRYRVLFVDPPTNRPRWAFGVSQVDESLWHATVASPLPLGRQIPLANRIGRWHTAKVLRRWLDERPGDRLLWLDEDLASPLVGALGETAVVYDATDLDWTFTRRWNRWNLRRSLRAALASADLVLASSAALPARLPGSSGRAVVVANGCDPDLFTPVGPSAAWLDRLPRPRVGYLGAIDTRAFDAGLVAAVARTHPSWTFVLVGPSTAAGRRPLAGLDNVVLHDAVSFVEAPAVLRGCDVGIVPYRTGGLIDYVHPKKVYEYLAVGLPVVTTGLPAMCELDAPIAVATGSAEFAAAIGDALSAGTSADAAGRRHAAVANSWQVRGDQLRPLLAELRSR